MKKKNAFYRILFSYIVIILTPMFILGSVLFDAFSTFFKNELINGRINLLNRMQITFDTFISEMNANSRLMLNSSIFTTSYLEREYGNMYDVIGRLATVSYTNSFFSDVFYINDDLKKIYTSGTVYDYDTFIKFNSEYSSEADDIPLLLLRNKYMYWLPEQNISNNGKKILTYVITDKKGHLPPKASIFYQIDEQTIRDLFGQFAENGSLCMVIADDKDNILYSSDDLAYKIWDEWKLNKIKNNTNHFTMIYEGEELFSYHADSKVSQLKYITLIPYENIIAPIKLYKTRSYFFIALVVVLGSCFISFFMKINYAPIQKISRLAQSIFGDHNEELNEFETTVKALNSITDLHQIQKKDRITLNLINGFYHTIDELYTEVRMNNYELSGPYFMLAVFNYSNVRRYVADIGFYNEIALFIEDNLAAYIDCAAISIPDNGSVCAVLSGEISELKKLDEKFKYIKNLLEYTYNMHFSIGIGGICSIENINDSYIQADIASKYRLLKGDSSINYYERIVSEVALQFKYPDYMLEMFYNAIKKGDKKRIDDSIEELTDYVSQQNNFFLATCLSYDIINIVLKAMRELDYSFTNIKNKYPDIMKKGNINSKKELSEILKTLTDEMLQVSQANEGKAHGENEAFISIFDQIMRYITLHYNESTFSAKTLASKFKMSVSNLSHYFKRNTGKTVSEYIAMLRFERAKELLRTTDLYINQVAEMCGYVSISTFIRQFKSQFNMTPSNYRSQYRK